MEGARIAAANRGDSPSDRPGALDVPSLLGAYRAARKRLVLLDYDGTLVGFYDRPQDAAPPPDLLKVLASLASIQQNSVLILSGRKRADLERWLGGVLRTVARG